MNFIRRLHIGFLRRMHADFMKAALVALLRFDLEHYKEFQAEAERTKRQIQLLEEAD